MVFTRLSRKHQTTVSAECIRQLGLAAGVTFRQWVEGNRIIMEPMPDVMSLFGSMPRPADIPLMSIREEKSAIEMAIAEDVMERARKH